MPPKYFLYGTKQLEKKTCDKREASSSSKSQQINGFVEYNFANIYKKYFFYRAEGFPF